MPSTRPLLTASSRATRTASYYAAFVALGLAGASLGPTLPGLAAQTRTPLSGISLLITAGALGYLLGSYQGGRWYDRLPGHPLMAALLLVMAATLGLTPLVPALWLLAGVRLLLGAAQGALDVGGNALLVWVHGRRVGPFMNGLHFCWGLGAFLSPVIVAQAMSLGGGITWAYWALALLVLPPALWLLRLPSPAAPAPPRDAAAAQVNRLLVALCSLFLFLYVGAEVGFGTWIYTYALSLGLSDGITAAYLTSAFWGALTAGRLLAIPIAARLAPRTILLGDLVGCLASVGLILLWPGSVGALWVGTVGAGLSMASIFPTTISLAGRRMAITGRVAGWFGVGASAGSICVPWVIGQLFEPIGPRVTMLAVVADLALAVGVYAALIVVSTPRLPARCRVAGGRSL
jgi:FHS family Na+ dependent glucose MFS transporter 1